ncbi:MAG TPA: HAMP domain-containing sensor histidine kinase, partial [Thermoanaerobaculia bacterium]
MAAGTSGIAVLCDAAGIIQEIVRDGLGLAGRVSPGQPLTAVVDGACVQKTEAFLDALRSHNAAFNWELNVPDGDGRVESLHFAGGAADGGFLIVGARSRSGVAGFYEELLRINNEQANALRSAIKEASLQTRTQVDRDNVYYDELSQLNNDLATAQRELAKSNNELARLNDQKSQFLGMAAHDLRNPLNIILTYSDFLLEDAAPALRAEQVKFIEAIRSSSEFMLRLVENLLDLAQIEAGKLELDLERTDLVALVERNVSLNQVLASRKGIEIRLHQSGEPLEMVADPVKLEQVLNNLIGNAVKFSPPGSPVDVRVTAGADAATLSVADRGPGVPADELDKLFRPFVRTRIRSTGGEKGTGLGLAIVKR